jgi:hypothetical protein
MDSPQLCCGLLNRHTSARTHWGDGLVAGFGRVIVIGALLAGLGIAAVRAQTVLGDPRDAAKTFASNCSTCHKSPRGLAKSGSVAGFLRQHYTTGPEMSAAMAAYLVAAGSAPEAKKGPAAADAAKAKSKKGEQLAAQPQAEGAEATQSRTLRGKERQQAKAHEEAPATHATPATHPAGEESRQAAVANTASPAATPAAAPPAAEPPAVLNIPMPPLPEGPPTDLVQSFFSSSPLP